MWGKPKGSKKRALRIYFATDLHGSEVCFRKFLAAARVYEADVIILGGDFAGKAIVPVLTENGTLRAQVSGEEATVPEAEWERLQGDLGKAGLRLVGQHGLHISGTLEDGIDEAVHTKGLYVAVKTDG